MDNQSACTSELIANNGFSSITVCPKCEVYHLHIGPMSFRLDAEMFESFSEMMTKLCLHPKTSLQKHQAVPHKH